jgi:3-deoxy-manno-octulosonate cytidylyltransferase (CMP-KDO synthetase)
MAVVAIIPARFGSTRLQGKPLLRIGDKPMIQHVYESTLRARGLDRVLIATDDRRIEETVRDFGGEAIMTSKSHRSGTDRLAEVAKKVKSNWVVNVQGDLPFIHPVTITRAVRAMRRNRSVPMGTVCTPIRSEEELHDPNIVKVVTDSNGFAIYFSRAPIPFQRNNISPRRVRTAQSKRKIWGYRHIGLYVYRRDFLLEFTRLRPVGLEQIERLEQLRALVYGYRIFVTRVNENSIEVDTPADLIKAEEYLLRGKR